MRCVNFNSDSSGEFNSGNWRGVIPGKAISKLPGHSYTILSVRRWLDNQPDAVRAMNRADLIVVQRVAVAETIEHIREWRGKGKTVVIDGDDDYFKIDSSNQAFSFWHEGLVEVQLSENIKYKKTLERHPLEMLGECIKYANSGTTPGKWLVDDWKQYGNMRFLPNYVDSERYLSVPLFDRNDDKIVIGYGGSMSHIQSFTESGINEALARVVQKRKNVMVLVCGDKRVWDNLPVPNHRKAHTNYVRSVWWGKVLRQFDIGVAPLARFYDHRRSSIKSQEYSLMGIPFVATRSRVYEDFEANNVGVYVSNGDYDKVSLEKRADEWETALLDMIDNLPEWKRKANGWVDYGMEWDVDRNAHKILSLYEEIATL